MNMLELLLSHRSRPTGKSTPLPAGDFRFIGQGPASPVLIGVERKRMSDLLNSKRQGRLSGEQLPKLHQHYDYYYLIIEARWKADWHTGELLEKRGRDWLPGFRGGTKNGIFTALELQSYLADITAKSPIQIIHTEDPRGTIDQVVALSYAWSKPWNSRHHHSDIHRPAQYAEIEKSSTVRRLSYSLTDIGWEKSREIEGEFDSVGEMCGMTREEMKERRMELVKRYMKLDGFGKVMSGKVVDELHGRIGEK